MPASPDTLSSSMLFTESGLFSLMRKSLTKRLKICNKREKSVITGLKSVTNGLKSVKNGLKSITNEKNL